MQHRYPWYTFVLYPWYTLLSFDNLHFHIYLPQVCPIRLLRFFTLKLLLLTISFTFKINTSRQACSVGHDIELHNCKPPVYEHLKALHFEQNDILYIKVFTIKLIRTYHTYLCNNWSVSRYVQCTVMVVQSQPLSSFFTIACRYFNISATVTVNQYGRRFWKHGFSVNIRQRRYFFLRSSLWTHNYLRNWSLSFKTRYYFNN